jgi:hypothetical protein
MVSFTAPPATDQSTVANCPVPVVKFRPVRVARGGKITITGTNFGDCLSSGSVPAPGPLGSPLTGLDISIVQDANEVVVATGSADDNYAFQVEVVVPAGLTPGKATLNVLAGDARMTIAPTLVISNASPIGSSDTTVATFGPPPSDTVPDGTLPAPILPDEIPDPDAVTVPPLATAPVAVDGGDSDEQRRVITVGIAVTVAISGLGFALWSRAQRRRW